MGVNVIMIKKIISILVLLLSPFAATAYFSVEKETNKIQFKAETWVGEINPNTLELKGGHHPSQCTVLADTPLELGKIENVIIDNNQISWYYPRHALKVLVSIKHNRLVLRFETTKEQHFIFPRTGQNETSEAFIFPNGEGLFIPQNDSFWEKQLVNTSFSVQDALSMPFWGHYGASNTITYILENDLNNELQCLKGQKLYVQLKHLFKKTNHQIAPFEISMTIGEKSPIQPALEYKKYLQEKKLLKTLKEKTLENKEIEKLFGAIHIYLWGTGRKLEALEAFQTLGFKNLWLGYDQDPRSAQYLMTPEFIQKAVQLGYLIGPYDSFHTMHNPKQADSPNTIFEDLYPAACIRNQDGKINVGFAGKGCHASSEAFVLQQPKNKSLYQRIDNFLKTGINSYFLDCDATGELFDDYSTQHPMTKDKDRANRLERMTYIASEKKMVLGSETAVAWAIPAIAFAHGNFSVFNYNPSVSKNSYNLNEEIHWPFSFYFRKFKAYGLWWPPEKPTLFFKQINVSTDYIKAKYDPRYRLPLFQTVFHEALITTDRWEISHLKIKNAVKERELLELLYGVPSIWSLDLEDIKKHSAHLRKLYQFFSSLHKIIATEDLKNFIWLDNERLIQQINFGDKIKLTANFSNIPYHDIPPKSLEAHWLKDDKKEYYSP